MTVEMSETIDGLYVSGTVVFGDWEGDPSVPGGVHHLEPYVEDLYVETEDGTDITGWLTRKAQEDLEMALLERIR